MRLRLSVLTVCILFISPAVFPQLKINDKQSINYLKANLQYLASDELEGRETGTRGEKLASLYIASEFQKYGIKPFGDNGGYFQNIPLSTNQYAPASKMAVTNNDGAVIAEFLIGNDFIKSAAGVCDSIYMQSSSGIIAAGFGITAPEYKYDDYEGIDVKGKTVLLLPDEPFSEDNNFFNGTKPTKYATMNSKVANAVKHGAAGVLLLPESWRMKFWDVYKKSSMKGTFAPPSGEPGVKMIPALILTEETAKKILADETFSFDQLSAGLERKTEYKPFALKKKIQYNLIDASEIKYARNVIGIIEGTDLKLKNEYVLLSAHYDHVGVTNNVVYNGADDDGSGAVSVLEAARIINENKMNKRSVIALLVTGEEKGLWGSRFASNYGSFIPNTVADVNIDMDGREHPDSIYVIGSDKLSTEYYNLIRTVNNQTVKLGFNYKFDDPNDPELFFYRSDHYNFALKGIPIVFFFDNMKKDYHKPTDDVDKISFEKMLKVTKLSANIALRAANLNHRLVVDKKLDTKPGLF